MTITQSIDARRFPWRRAFLLFGIALLVKAAVLVALRDHPLLQPRGELDTAVYVELARHLPAKPFFVSPLYLYFLRATGISLLSARIIQILLGSVGVVLIFDTARRWFGERAATIGAVLAILTGVITFNEITILQSALDPFLVALALWSLTIALQSESIGAFAGTGIALGLLALNRPNAALWMPVLVLGVLWVRKLMRAIVLSVAFFIPIIPVTVRNLVVSGQFVMIASHGGLNFYIGNNLAADGTYHHVPGIRPTILGQEEDAPRAAARAMHRSTATAEEASSFYYRQAWNWIRSEPGAAFALLIEKIAYTFNQTDLALNYSYSFFSRDVRSPLTILIVGPWLLFPLGLAGAARKLKDRAFAVWATFIPLYALSVAFFFVSSRYRLPLLIPMCITAGAMFIRPRVGSWVAAALIAIVVCWNFGLDDGRAHERTNFIVYLIEQRRVPEAEQWIASTAAMTRDPATLYLRSAHAYGAIGEADRTMAMVTAMQSITLQPDEALDAAQMARDLGAGFVRTNQPDKALQMFEAAHRLDPTNASDVLNMAVLQAQRGDYEAARRNARLAIEMRRDMYPQAEGLLHALEGR